MNFFDIKIENQRLVMVPIELSYAEENFMHMNSDVTKYMYPKPADDISETITWIESARERMEKGSNVQLVILEKDSGDFLGCAGLHHVDTENQNSASGLRKTLTATAMAGKP